MVAIRDEPQRLRRLTPLAEALARIEPFIAPVPPRRLGLAEANGSTLAEAITAPRDAPPHAIAMRDGLAVAASSTDDAGAFAPLPLSGSPAVDVGDAMPDGCDAVASWELIDGGAGRYQIAMPLAPGDGVLPAAADSRAGAVLVQAGHRLRPVDLAVLAALGIDSVAVRCPNVTMRLARPDPLLAAIADLLARHWHEFGARVHRSEPQALESADHELLVLVGGSGAGRHDDSVRRLQRLGRVLVHGVAISPGATCALGLIETRPVLVVPGRLDAALAAMALVGDPIMARLGGGAAPNPANRAELTRKVTSTIGLTEFVPVRIAAQRAEPLGTGHVPLAALAQADGYVVVPPESEGYPAGTPVAVRPLS